MLTLFDRREPRHTVLAPLARKAAGTLQPFGLSPDQRFIHRNDSYIWAFEQITTAVRQREGVVLVIGDPGTGKTLLCRTLLSRLSDRHLISVVVDPCVTFEELLVQMLLDFGVLQGPRAGDGLSRYDLVSTLHRFLASLIPINATAILVIDEAQHLDPVVLEQLRLLSNCESDYAKLLQIVLVGTPALEDACRSTGMQHLEQRIARRCRLRPLQRDEVRDYIASRLVAAGFDAEEFSNEAATAVATLSGGVPRTINLLCERSLDIARRRGVSPIDTSIVRAAARQLDIPVSRTWSVRRRTAVVASVLLVGVPPVTWLYESQGVRVTQAAVSSVAPDGQPAAAISSVAVTAATVPGTVDEVVSGTLPLADGLTIQVAAFREADRAAAVIQQLRGAGLPAFRRTDPNAPRHLVLVGPYVTEGETEAVQHVLAMQGFAHTKVVHEDAGILLP